MFTKFGRTAIASVMVLLSAVAFAQVTPFTNPELMKARLAEIEIEVKRRDREAGWEYSMEAEYVLLVLQRTRQALEEAERERSADKFGEALLHNERLQAAYNRFVELTTDKREPRVWQN